MILVDTSVWVDHLRSGDPVLAELLEQSRVVIDIQCDFRRRLLPRILYPFNH